VQFSTEVFSVILQWLSALVPALLISQAAYPQVGSGTVIVVNVSQEDVTIAADSRTTFSNGAHSDTECKISAFGKAFAFTMSGTVSKGNAWNAHDIARKSWSAAATLGLSATDTVHDVADRWLPEMINRYQDKDIIEEAIRLSPDNRTLGAGLFAGKDSGGRIAVEAVNIDYDKATFLSTGQIKLTHQIGMVARHPECCGPGF
jgi:hypothetical protein